MLNQNQLNLRGGRFAFVILILVPNLFISTWKRACRFRIYGVYPSFYLFLFFVLYFIYSFLLRYSIDILFILFCPF